MSTTNVEPPVFKIHQGLIEAYKGYYEDDSETIRRFTDSKGLFCHDLFNEWIQLKIVSDTPAERLERYCEWEGIIGYANTLFSIATGKLC